MLSKVCQFDYIILIPTLVYVRNFISAIVTTLLIMNYFLSKHLDQYRLIHYLRVKNFCRFPGSVKIFKTWIKCKSKESRKTGIKPLLQKILRFSHRRKIFN